MTSPLGYNGLTLKIGIHMPKLTLVTLLSLYLLNVLATEQRTLQKLELNILQWDKNINTTKMKSFKSAIKNELNIDLNIKVENIVDEKMLFDRTRSGAADMIFPGIDIVQDKSFKFKERQLVMPLDPKRLKNFKGLANHYQNPSFLTYKGKLYGVPFAKGQVSLFYNADKIKPQRFEDILNAPKNLKVGTLDFSPHVLYVVAMALNIKEESLNDFTYLSKNGEFTTALRNWAHRASVFFDLGTDNAEQAKDLVAFIGWGYSLKELLLTYHQNWKVLDLPGGTIAWLDSIMVPAHVAKDPLKEKVIYKLLDFLISESYQRDVVLNELSSLPVNKNALKGLSEVKGLHHLYDLDQENNIIYLPTLNDRRTRNGMQLLWRKAKNSDATSFEEWLQRPWPHDHLSFSR